MLDDDCVVMKVKVEELQDRDRDRRGAWLGSGEEVNGNAG